MNNSVFENFIKAAAQAGINLDDAFELYNLKTANDMVAPQPPAEDSEVPAELEQLIQQLPPEAIQQLIAELEQQMAGQQDGAVMSPEEEMPKQASVNEPLIKQAAYVDGFIEAAKSRGFTDEEISTIYKSACDIVLQEHTFQQKVASLDSHSAMHFEGFLSQAESLGLEPKQAAEVYFSAFNK